MEHSHSMLRENVPMDEHMKIKKNIKYDLMHENIQHVTIELERSDEDFEELDCD